MNSISPLLRKIHKKYRSGMTLIELLVVVSVLSIMAAMGFYAASGVVNSTRNTKLMKDVAVINQAIRTYEAAGGSVSGLTDPQAVLNKLKTTLSGNSKRMNATALRGALLDAGLKANMLSGVPSPTQQRAVWEPTNRNFVVLNDNGTDGVKDFSIDSTLATVDYGSDTGRTSTNNLAVTSNWVWDSTPSSPTQRNPKLVTDTGTAAEPNPGTGTLLDALLPPTFSIPGGSRSLASYPLNLQLNNLNTGKPSEIFYAVDSGVYNPYVPGTNIVVDAGQQIQAMVYSLQPDRYSDSSVAVQTYTTSPVTLAGTLTFSKGGYSYFEMGGNSAAAASTVTPPVGTLLLTNGASIPLRYQASTYFNGKWSFDGSDPLGTTGTVITGPGFNSGFPVAGMNVPLSMGDYTNAVSGVLGVKYVLKTADNRVLFSSTVNTVNLTMTKLPLQAPDITIVSRDTTIATSQSPATLPAGYRMFYTTDGQDPGDNAGEPLRGTLYTGLFQSPGAWGATVVITARVYPPTSAKDWFITSPASTKSVVLLNAEDFFVGGSFYHPSGSPKRNIARILGAGTVDTNFDTGAGASYDSLVGVVRRANAGGVYAGGDFTSVNTTTRAAFARLNANGSVDTGFNANLTNN